MQMSLARTKRLANCLSLCLIGTMVFPSVLSAVQVRPLRLVVLDADSRQPLANLTVYYRLTLAAPRHFLGIPNMSNIKFRDVAIEHHESDASGVVWIPARNVRLGLYERLLDETVCLNLVFDDDRANGPQSPEQFFSSWNRFLTQEKGKLVFPLHDHRGIVLHSSWDVRPDWGKREPQAGNILFVWRSGSLKKDREDIEILLPMSSAGP